MKITNIASIVDTTHLPHSPTTGFTPILNVVFAMLGALAFLMIVVAGFRYTISGGDANKVAESRRMIIYAAAGLVVVTLAAAIVNLVLSKI